MLAKIRQGLKDYKPQKNSKFQRRASVLIPLIEIRGELFVLFTERSKHLRSHPGQVSFPGAKKDYQDTNSIDTALRETHEEIGLNPEKVEILGRIDQIISLYNYLVTPFVGLIPSDFKPNPNRNEIEKIFKVPISFFLNGKNHWSEEYKSPSTKVLIHHFDFDGFDIWGLTAKLILRLLEIGLDHSPDFLVHHPDYPTWMERAQDNHEIDHLY